MMPIPGISAAPILRRRGVDNIIGIAVEAGAKTHSRIDASGNTLSGSQYDFGGAYYASHALFQFVEEVIDGQDMIRIPAMWYKRETISGGTHNGKEAWWVADHPAAGFVLHPAFMKDGNPIPHFWIGKYQGVNDGGTKLGSFGGTTPLVSLNIGQFRDRAAARNTGGMTGFMQWSIYQLAVVQMLCMIESGSTDSQAAIGNGRVSQSSAANVDAADVAQASYRGLVGLWGNVWQWLEGLDYASGVVRFWDREGNKSWVSTGLTTKPSNNFTLTVNGSSGSGYNFRDVFFPLSTANEANSTWPDYIFASYTGDRVARHGGDWGGGSIAGLWALDCGGSAAAASPFLGSRLAKEP